MAIFVVFVQNTLVHMGSFYREKPLQESVGFTRWHLGRLGCQVAELKEWLGGE